MLLPVVFRPSERYLIRCFRQLNNRPVFYNCSVTHYNNCPARCSGLMLNFAGTKSRQSDEADGNEK